MTQNSRFIAINGRELRTQRLVRGWTQQRLAKIAGYTERLVRKAEKGGTLDIATIQDLAEALSTPAQAVAVESLTMDISAIARKWVESWELLETRMLPEIEPFLAEDFEFVCPGEPGAAPFVGTFRGAVGMQQWLDAYFSVLQRNKISKWSTWSEKIPSSPDGWRVALSSVCRPRPSKSTCTFGLSMD